MGLLDGFLTQVATGDKIKDFAHASRLFVGDNFRLAPKQGYLYHVFFDLDPSISRLGREQQIEAGMLVKSVDLPKFTVDTKSLNSYNKNNIIQTKVKFDSLTIAFHDDHADVVRNLWFDYYHYYFRDADLGFADRAGSVNPNYFLPTKYGDRTNNNFGYNPRNYSSFSGNMIQQYIKSIRIYSLHQKRFSEYTLVNPVITSFRHGQHQAGSAEPMGHEMSISYEFVLYAAGNVSKNTVKGFADIHYDNSPSPLTPAGGGTQSILGPGGLLDTASSAIEDLSKEPPDYASAMFKGLRGLKNLKNMNLGSAAKAELGQVGMDILRGNNPLNRISIPSIGNLANLGVAGAVAGGGTGALPPSVAISNGEGVGTTRNAAAAGTVLAGVGAAVLMGSRAGGLLTVGGLVAGAGALNKMMNVNPATGAVESVSTLSNKTAAEQKLDTIPGKSVNDYMDSYLQNYVENAPNNTAATVALREGADAAAQKNITDLASNTEASLQNLAKYTSTPLSSAQVQQATSGISAGIATVTSGVPSELLAQSLQNRSATLEQNPNANLNTDSEYASSTNQQTVGYDAPTDWGDSA